MKIVLGENTYDLTQALPLTLGDLRRLKKEQGVEIKDLAAMDVGVVVKLMLHIFHKLDPAVTEEQVDNLPITVLADVAAFLSAATVPDRPTSG